MKLRDSKGRLLHFWRSVLATILTLITATASAALVGNPKKVDPILAMLVEPLHLKGIDVVGGDTASVPLNQRPRIARLSGVPVPQNQDALPQAQWMRDFLNGAVGVVAAVKPEAPPTEAANTSDEFLARWNAAPREKRVFLSFTSADAHLAEIAAQALQAQGYVTFTFLKASESSPTHDAKTVGAVFADAGHHFVVDTPNARKSRGVWLESASLALLPRRPPPPSGPSGETSPPSGAPPSAPKSPPPPSKPPVEFSADGETRQEIGEARRTKTSLPSVDDLKKGIRDSRWIVTKNPDAPNKIFVHRYKDENGFLRDPLYVIKVERGGAWSVHEPTPGPTGIGFGRRIGRTAPPARIAIGRCGCR